MTDLEMVGLCAIAMQETVKEYNGLLFFSGPSYDHHQHQKHYDPLHDDAQAFALIEKLWMYLNPPLRDRRARNKLWYANVPAVDDYHVQNSDLKRAIVESVALMQKAKSGASA